jgi:protein O-mannosyl-transferase
MRKFFNTKTYLILIAIITALAFYPTLKSQFLNWDDNMYVTTNPYIKNLSFVTIRHIFSSFHLGLYKPVVLLSFAIEKHFFGFNPFPYHLNNLLFHIFNCIFVFFLLRRLKLCSWGAFFATLLFAVHPMRVESVAWIAERKDVLYVFFALASMLSYLKYRENRNPLLWYWFSVVLFSFSLMCKPMGITLPILLFLFDYFYEEKNIKNSFRDKIPFVLLSVGIFMLSVFSASEAKALYVRQGYNRFDYFMLGFYSLYEYVKRLFIPLDLSAFYPYPQKTGFLLPLKYVIGSLSSIVSLSLIGWFFRKNRKIIFGVFFFVVSILPGLQFLPASPSLSADHYSYLPYFGLIYLAGELFCFFYRKGKKASLFSLCGLILLSLSVLTYQRCVVWQNSVNLWSDVLKKYPDEPVALTNRTDAYIGEKMYDKAFADVNKVIRLQPNVVSGYINRGIAYAMLNEDTKAEQDFKKGLEIAPRSVKVYLNYANIYMKDGKDHSRAVGFYKKTIEISPRNPDLYNNLGSAYLLSKDFAKAKDAFSKAIRLDGDFILAYEGKFRACEALKDEKCSLETLNALVKSNPKNPNSLMTRGIHYYFRNKFTKAAEDFSQVIIINSEFFDAYVYRSLILAKLGQNVLALRDVKKALEINPSDEKMSELKKRLEKAIKKNED